MRKTLSVIVLALLAGAALAPADKRDDQLLEIQRDVADVSEKVSNLQKAQAAQVKEIEDLRALVQQAAAAAAKTSQDMEALKTALTNSVNAALADQQAKMSQSITVPLGSRIDGLSTTVDQLNTSFAAMSDRITKLDKELGAINDKVSLLNAPAPAAPPPPDGAAGNGVPPGVNKLGLQQAAQSDILSSNDEQALKELASYINYWPMDAFAPTAGYQIGMIYLNHVKDYESAAEAFQKVIDNYPGINQSQDALYQKGRALDLGGHKKEALETLRQFVHDYPFNDNVKAAQAEISKLTGAQAKGRGGRGPAPK